MLQVDYSSFIYVFKNPDVLFDILWKCDIREDLQIGSAEKMQAGFSLDLPEVTICIDDTISFQNSAIGFLNNY